MIEDKIVDKDNISIVERYKVIEAFRCLVWVKRVRR